VLLEKREILDSIYDTDMGLSSSTFEVLIVIERGKFSIKETTHCSHHIFSKKSPKSSPFPHR
jgi:hypothetical protein